MRSVVNVVVVWMVSSINALAQVWFLVGCGSVWEGESGGGEALKKEQFISSVVLK